MNIPVIGISQKPAQIEVSTRQARLDLDQQEAVLLIESRPTEMKMEQASLSLEINLDQMHNALTGGSFTEFNNRIYSQMPAVILRAIAAKVDEGNQLAAIHKPGNTVAEIIGTRWNDYPKIEFLAPASSQMVDFLFKLKPLKIDINPGGVTFQVQPARVDTEYQPGGVDYRVKQYARVEYTPPQLDTII